MKKKLLIILSLFITALVVAQPANDNCTGATNLGTLATPGPCGGGIQNGATTTIAGTLVAATPENPYVSLAGCGMASPANDVWYMFTAPPSGYGLVITVNGATFTNPNIALYNGTNCNNLAGIGCVVGAAGAATINIGSGIIPGQTYYLQISGNTGQTGTFNLHVHAYQDCSACLNASTLTVNPLPVNGTYQPGQTVNFCFHIDQWTQIANNWLHGVQLAFGAGWNLASLTTTPPPPFISNSNYWGPPAGSCGNWSYYPLGITSTATGVVWPPGFYYDGTYTTDILGNVTGCVSVDGNPGNNFGDGVGCAGCLTNPTAADWNFCWSIQVLPGCNPGMSLAVNVGTSGDGESGAWASLGCANDPVANFNAIISCCPPTIGSTPSCSGANTGTATATPVGAAGPYTYSWALGGQTTPTATNLGPGTYTVTVTDANLCVATNTVTVAAITPTVAAAGPNQTVCGTTATLAGNIAAVGTGTWTLVSGTGTITNPASPTSGLTGLGAGANVFQWTITDPPCPATNSQVTITAVLQPSVANAGIDQTVCGLNATMAGNNPVVGTGLWTLISGAGTITNPASPTTTITGLGVGANVFQWEIDNLPCPPSTDQVTITSVGVPTVAVAGPNQTICGTTATMAATPVVVGTGLWTLISGTGTITTPTSPTTTITGLGVGANVFQWEVDDLPCPQTTSQVTITAATPPTVANAGPNQSICVNNTTLAGNAAVVGVGVWTLVSGTGTITNSALFNTTVTGLGLGANVFQWTITVANCPPSTSQVTITTGVNPTVSIAGANQTVCGAAATMAANVAAVGIGTWTVISGSGTITNPNSEVTTITGLGVGANVFQWTIASPPCPASSSQVTITSDGIPTVANAGPNQTVCGTNATLAGNTALVGVGTWTLISGAGTITNPNSETSTITGLGAGANVFQWEIDNPICPPTTSQVTITGVTPPTVAVAGPNQTVCGTNATMAANVAALGVGTWTVISGSGTITNPNSEVSTITALGVGANVFQWTIANAPCPASSSQVTISGVANPTVAVAGPNQAICVNTATLAGNVAAVGVGIWTLVSGTGTITNPASPTSGLTALGLGANVFQWTITNAPCPASSSQVTITVNPIPVVGVNSPTICAGQAAILTGTGAATYTWSAGANPTGGATASASPLTTTTYTVTGTSLNCSSTAVSTVTVNPLPTATVSGGGSVCFGNPTPSVVITFTGTGPWNFTYTDGITPVALVTATSPYTIANPPPGTYTVTSVSDVHCTGTFSGSAPVIINPLPVPLFTGPTSGCVPYCETFVNTSSIPSGTITGYNWNFGNGPASISNQQNPTYCYNNTGTYSVTLTDTSNFGCTATVTSTNFITIYPVPEAAFSCPLVHSIIYPNIQFTNYSTGATGYSWNFGDSYNPSTNTSTAQNPTHLYSQLGSYCVLLTVTNGHCIDTTEICLLIEPEFTFYIPNAFSPNGDGTNDEFFGKGEGIIEYEMDIYDRWGERIFTGNSLDAHWDGTVNGHLVQQDVYVYVVNLTDVHNETHKYIGSVTVVR